VYGIGKPSYGHEQDCGTKKSWPVTNIRDAKLRRSALGGMSNQISVTNDVATSLRSLLYRHDCGALSTTNVRCFYKIS
jgi:hypothetical protein